MASDILIVDDEADIRELVAGVLEDEGHALLYFPIYNYTEGSLDNVAAMMNHVAALPGLSWITYEAYDEREIGAAFAANHLIEEWEPRDRKIRRR